MHLFWRVHEPWFDLHSARLFCARLRVPGEVDGLGERPRDVLPDSRRRLKAARDPVDAPLVEQPWVRV